MPDYTPEQIQKLVEAAQIAESNELLLRRKLQPYTDAELQMRDDRIAELEAQVEDLAEELEEQSGD